jgi:hypothetical protein
MRVRPAVDERWERLLRALRERRAGIEPDPAFASRVLARLPRRSPDALGWAAGRLVPVGLALALALGWAALRAGGAASEVEAADALARWVVAGLGEPR